MAGQSPQPHPQVEWFLNWLRETTILSMTYAPDDCPDGYTGIAHEDAAKLTLTVELLIKRVAGNRTLVTPQTFRDLYVATLRECLARVEFDPTEADTDDDG